MTSESKNAVMLQQNNASGHYSVVFYLFSQGY